jgi:hypothetical protein
MSLPSPSESLTRSYARRETRFGKELGYEFAGEAAVAAKPRRL